MNVNGSNTSMKRQRLRPEGDTEGHPHPFSSPTSQTDPHRIPDPQGLPSVPASLRGLLHLCFTFIIKKFKQLENLKIMQHPSIHHCGCSTPHLPTIAPVSPSNEGALMRPRLPQSNHRTSHIPAPSGAVGDTTRRTGFTGTVRPIPKTPLSPRSGGRRLQGTPIRSPLLGQCRSSPALSSHLKCSASVLMTLPCQQAGALSVSWAGATCNSSHPQPLAPCNTARPPDSRPVRVLSYSG